LAVEAVARITVGDWLVDPSANEISRGSAVQRLEPKVIEVLLALAQHAGEVVSRETLLSRVWTNVVVSDDALTQSIAKLRHAFGDTTKEPRYIETVPKRGYRLVAEVAATEPLRIVAAPTITPPAPARRRVLPWAIVAVFITAMTGWLFLPAPLRVPTTADLQPNIASLADFERLPTIEVQPFREIAGDALQTLLARGFTARLINDLSRIHDIRVITSSASSGANQSGAPRNSAAGTYIFSGEVQRNGEHIRMYARLTDAASGQSIWSEQYDRLYADLFRLQDDLTREALSALRLKLSDAELRRSARPYTRSVEAYEYFLRAQAALIARRKPENELARQMYAKAIALDPNFARAHAGVALTYAADRRNEWQADGAAALTQAFEIAKHARQIDPDVAEVYFALAYVEMERGALADAVDDLKTALRISPSFADAYALLAALQTYRGNPKETVALMRVAMRLVPDPGHLYLMILGRAHFFLKDPMSATLYLRQAVARNPESLESRIFLAAALSAADQRDQAAWEAEEILILEPGFKLRQWLKTYPLTDGAQIKQLTDAIAGLGLS
jgi:DNA-binding winged helix-turn-helix (wHTH) protein/TolB-like protein/Tfp pilus assembly protein PilF